MSYCLGKTTIKSTQFRSKAGALAFIKQHITSEYDGSTVTLKNMQTKIQHYLEKHQRLHRKCGTIGIVTLNKEVQLTALCQGNSDNLAASSNSQMAIYLVTTNFDGVGILGTITLTIEYLEGWNDVTSLALSGDNLALCVDGKIYVHNIPQNNTTLVTNGLSPISYKATSVPWLERGLVCCERYCIKLYDDNIVSVISGGNLKGDVDGPASHLLLCQPVGICTEFSRNIYIADSGSGSIKLTNRPLHGIVEFLSNLQTLLTAFHIHAKGKFLVTTHHTVSEAIEMVNQTLEYVKSCSLKAKKL